MAGVVLALNAGSSSLKFALFDRDGPIERLRGSVASTDGNRANFNAVDGKGRVVAEEQWNDLGEDRLLERLTCWLERHLESDQLVAAGHRVVHGGSEFSGPVRIDAAILARLEALTPLAPLHQPGSLRPIRQLANLRPALTQVACFDTAFHHGMTPPASRYPVPRSLEIEGIKRYGFHGLSYESIAATLRKLDDGAVGERIVVSHLGSGASLCALSTLRSVDTTMGFSALDGVMMGTRPGALDPGILLYLLREKGYDLDRLEHLLYHECGLAGVSGLTSDVQQLTASHLVEAKEALELFAFSVARNVAAMATSLGGIDRLIFTGGIGEHSWQVRAMIAQRLEWLGLKLDPQANAKQLSVISANGSPVRVQVLPTNEEAVIARHVVSLLNETQSAPQAESG